jgi:hypothetical protein
MYWRIDLLTSEEVRLHFKGTFVNSALNVGSDFALDFHFRGMMLMGRRESSQSARRRKGYR